MRWCCWLLIAFFLGSTTGCSCGGSAASGIKPRAISNEADEEVAPVAVAAAPPPMSEPAPEPAPMPPPTPAPMPAPMVTTAPPPMPVPEPAPPPTPDPAAVATPPADPASDQPAPTTPVTANADLPDAPPPKAPADPMPAPAPQVTEATPEKTPAATAPPQDPRLPIPDESDQQAGKRILAELYKDDYEQAKTPDQKLELARQLATKAATFEDTTGKYLLYMLVLDLSKSAGNVGLSVEAIDILSTHFRVDGLSEKLSTFEGLAKTLRSKPEADKLLEQITGIIRYAIDHDNFEMATRSITIGETVAKRGRMNEALDQLEQYRKLVTEARAAYANVPPARSALETSETNAEANLEVGRYLCLYKRQWDEGLPHLAQGSDVKLKVLAQIDHSGPKTGTQQADLADQWYDLAQTGFKSHAQKSLSLRAAHWYQQAFNSLPNGLIKSRVQKRLADIADNTGDPSIKEFVANSKNAVPLE